ncbi:MAG: hypothetical protein FJW66_08740 [Actinobacteria bacterium]|nr:hypothetical protein [Actinomycetota bacterium]
MDVNDLYDISLYHSYNINPWGCNEEKVFLPLKNRYEFVKIYFEADGNLTEDIILNSNYYKLLQKDIDETPRDGGNNWVYKSPMDQVKRFIKLMASFRDNGYLGVDNTHNALEEFDNAPEIVSKDGSMQFQSNNDGGYRGLISFRPCSGAYKVHNGLHRLAILKYMWDSGSLASPRIIGRKIDDMPFVPEDTQNVVYDELGYPVGTSANKKNGSKGIFLRKFKKVINGVKTKLNNVGLRIGLF